MPTAVLEQIGLAAARIARGRRLDPRGVASILGVPQAALGRAETNTPRLSVDELGCLYEDAVGTRRHPDRRKRDGMFYTPPALVEPTVARALGTLAKQGPDDVAVCDPASGGGAFLLAALRAFAGPDLGPGARRRALGAVRGVDRDADAVRVARLSLWLEVADPDLDPDAVEPHVRHGDALVGSVRRDADEFDTGWPGSPTPPMHWKTDFPDVFARGGFDAVIGNPPWDIQKPDSRRFFSAVDPEYANLSKQDALVLQQRLLEADAGLASRWREELEYHDSFGQWIRNGGEFTRQGRGDANCYKLFVERGWSLLQDGGRLGMIVPSGLYTDSGCRELRRMLLDDGKWEWLFGFENRRGVFPIDGRFKFAAVIARKGGTTRAIPASFMHTDVDDWRKPEAHAVELAVADIRTLSPTHEAIPEIASERDLDVMRRIYTNAVPFSETLAEGLEYRRELDQTMHAHRFGTRTAWEGRGFCVDEHATWRHPDDDAIGVPLYEGRMIGQYDCSEKGWVEGRGRRAVWRTIGFDAKRLEPQFVLDRRELEAVDPRHSVPKIGFMAIGSATNRRTMIAASLIGAACGNSVPTLRSDDVADDLCVLAVLNSFVFDYALRIRMGGTNLNQFVLAETPMLPRTVRAALAPITADVAALSWILPRYDAAWASLGLPRAHAVARIDRLERRCRLDAVVAAAFGLTELHLEWILRDCDHDVEALQSNTHTRTLDQKGFWRVDRDRDPADRHTALTLRAFSDLQNRVDRIGGLETAIADFCTGANAWSIQQTASP